ncbi:hypothetical protein GWI33_015290 [Rhynchophorus ferrugineus]|uniref:Uncharacterized protein n=1 Tax=Rhynchophorus ferrugineus TaxID=354439 RepID=A0A834M4M8_RHYFE|nr:hypothetical protein GWI33_015290 [Rhynchophorus ferrugineus]
MAIVTRVTPIVSVRYSICDIYRGRDRGPEREPRTISHCSSNKSLSASQIAIPSKARPLISDLAFHYRDPPSADVDSNRIERWNFICRLISIQPEIEIPKWYHCTPQKNCYMADS